MSCDTTQTKAAVRVFTDLRAKQTTNAQILYDFVKTSVICGNPARL
jgi:hypothetical protein